MAGTCLLQWLDKHLPVCAFTGQHPLWKHPILCQWFYLNFIPPVTWVQLCLNLPTFRTFSSSFCQVVSMCPQPHGEIIGLYQDHWFAWRLCEGSHSLAHLSCHRSQEYCEYCYLEKQNPEQQNYSVLPSFSSSLFSHKQVFCWIVGRIS